MLDVIKKLFGSGVDRELKKLWPVVDEIKSFESKVKGLSEDELKGKTDEYRQAIRDSVVEIEQEQAEVKRQLKLGVSAENTNESGEPGNMSLAERHDLYARLDELDEEWIEVIEDTLNDLLPEAFAVVKEVCTRMIGQKWTAGGTEVEWDMIPYDVQLLGGVAIHQGRIAEMKTGEGKTLVAVAPIYLNALVGRGVHIVTVNPYLAQRDCEWMAPVFEYLGLKSDVIDKYDAHSPGRREAYRADITYGTNNEYGFDYLRDNSFVVDPDALVQRDHHFAIVDEVDSVLIDEARTPLIISGPVPQPDDDRFTELRSPIDRVVTQQKKLVAHLVGDAERLLKERDEAASKGDKKVANVKETDAGLAVLRASRGFQKNKRLRKLLSEPGVAQLMQRTEFHYLQDNAKNMPFVDDELYYALDEKQHAIEMTEKGRQYIAKAAGQEEDLFVLPDIGLEVAGFEQNHLASMKKLDETYADIILDEEKKQNKLVNDQRLLKKELDDSKRTLYNMYADRAERLHAIEQLLKAYTLYEKDIEYIVQDGRVMIVDTHTGRVLPGRRYSDGLHQAIEAKEQVKVQAPTQTYATVTLQNYFRMYSKLSGMTGTAETEAEELHKIYSVDVVVVPTNRPITRDDKNDLIFKSKRAKYSAVIDKVREYNENGQPVLVGTTSVEVSETLSRMLQRAGVKHQVLNAKRDRAELEAHIVADAGKKGAVTIATNMAGRGTDIKLGPGVRESGGLAIIGTERHESRRIDLQLRGRAGRQGDDGVSQFYVSLDDNLMRLFSSDRVAKVMDRMNLEEDAVIEHPWVNKSIERAQKKVEQNNFGIRKRQLEYDDVLNAQREVIYDRRRHALLGERMRGDLMDTLGDVIEIMVHPHYAEGTFDELREEILRTLAFDLDIDRETFVNLGDDGVTDRVFEAAMEFYNRKRDALASPFYQSMLNINSSEQENKPERVFVDFTDGKKMIRAVAKISDSIETKGQEVNDAMERSALLSIIDSNWTEHLRNLDELKEGIGLRAFGQRDPLIEYKMEAYKMFAELMGTIGNEFVSFVMRSGPLVDGQKQNVRAGAPRRKLDPRRAKAEHEAPKSSFGVGADGAGSGNRESRERDPSVRTQPVVVDDKVGRNDDCPCGSGKKYKHCHGRR